MSRDRRFPLFVFLNNDIHQSQCHLYCFNNAFDSSVRSVRKYRLCRFEQKYLKLFFLSVNKNKLISTTNFSNFSSMFLNPNHFSNLNYNCSVSKKIQISMLTTQLLYKPHLITWILQFGPLGNFFLLIKKSRNLPKTATAGFPRFPEVSGSLTDHTVQLLWRSLLTKEPTFCCPFAILIQKKY